MEREGYRLLGFLSSGVSANVYRAEKGGLEFAVKACRLPLDPEIRSLREEHRLLSSLCHPHVARVYDFFPTVSLEGELGKWDCMVMECGKIDLLDLLVQEGRLPEARAKRYFRQMVEAVAYLHAQSIVHSDVKCENFVLMPDDTVRLLDFGFAFCYSPSDRRKNPRGTPLYAAPEQLYGRLHSGPEVDVWALGCCFYALLTAEMPVSDASKDPYAAIREQRLRFSVLCSAASRSLILELLTIDHERRMTSRQLLDDARLA